MRIKIRRLLPLVILPLIFAACTPNEVGEDQIGIRYTAGSSDGRHCEKVVEPGDVEWTGNDEIFKINANLRSYIVSNDKEVGDRPQGDELIFSTKGPEGQGGPQVGMEVETRFFVNTRTKQLACDFFLNVCKKYDGGNSCSTDKGWSEMLEENFRVPMQSVVNEIGVEYDSDKLRYDNDTKVAFATRFAEEFANNLETLLGRDDYFCGPGYKRDEKGCPPIAMVVTSVRYIDEDLEDIPNQRRLAVEQAQLAEEQRTAAVAAQSVFDKQVTAEYVAKRNLDIALACARNPNPGACTLILNQNGAEAPSIAVAPG